MFKTLLAATLAVVITTGCADRATPLNFPSLPADMADCKITKLENASGQHIILARCPNSATTASYNVGSGKSQRTETTITVDGVNYVKEMK